MQELVDKVVSKCEASAHGPSGPPTQGFRWRLRGRQGPKRSRVLLKVRALLRSLVPKTLCGVVVATTMPENAIAKQLGRATITLKHSASNASSGGIGTAKYL